VTTYKGQHADGLAFRRVAERLEAAAGEWRALQDAAEGASWQLKVLDRAMSARGFPHVAESAEVAQNIAGFLRGTWYIIGDDMGGAPIPDFAAVDEPVAPSARRTVAKWLNRHAGSAEWPLDAELAEGLREAAPFALRTVAELLDLHAGSAEHPLAPALAEGLREIAGRKERTL